MKYGFIFTVSDFVTFTFLSEPLFSSTVLVYFSVLTVVTHVVSSSIAWFSFSQMLWFVYWFAFRMGNVFLWVPTQPFSLKFIKFIVGCRTRYFRNTARSSLRYGKFPGIVSEYFSCSICSIFLQEHQLWVCGISFVSLTCLPSFLLSSSPLLLHLIWFFSPLSSCPCLPSAASNVIVLH